MDIDSDMAVSINSGIERAPLQGIAVKELNKYTLPRYGYIENNK